MTSSGDSEDQTLWDVAGPGIRKRRIKRGPWLQAHDATGFEWNELELAIDELPDALVGFRILNISDLHIRPDEWTKPHDDLLARIVKNPPDLLLITGDYFEETADPLPALSLVKKFLRPLTARFGVYGIRGNHDALTSISLIADQTPLKLLEGESLDVTGPEGALIDLVALPGPMRESMEPGWPANVKPRRPGVPRIVMSHYPDHFPKIAKAIDPDIFLAGHTHGGQVCLPSGYPLIRHDSMPHRLCAGTHRLGRCWYIVNRGFGFGDVQLRFFCPAEVIEIRLVKSPES